MKKALQLAGKVNMIDQFCIPNIRLLQSLGFSVDVVSDFTDPGTISKERAKNLEKRLKEMDVGVYDIPIPRSLNWSSISFAYKKIKALIETEKYDLVHCHSPIGAAICRYAARKVRRNGLKVIYTAHGFHFYTGAPFKNWVLYYSAEKILSKYTDLLITINREDYSRAKKKFKGLRTIYLPGIGVDTQRFYPGAGNRNRIRTELSLSDSEIMVLSVGELNKNKNHERVIRAISGLDLVYVVVGKGELKDHLENVAQECNVKLYLMGYRNDVIDFYAAADVFVLPSIREGLNVSLMEAMASGLSVACSRIRGNVDLIETPLFSPTNESEIRESILYAIENKELIRNRNLEKIKEFDLVSINSIMKQVYENV